MEKEEIQQHIKAVAQDWEREYFISNHTVDFSDDLPVDSMVAKVWHHRVNFGYVDILHKKHGYTDPHQLISGSAFLASSMVEPLTFFFNENFDLMLVLGG